MIRIPNSWFVAAAALGLLAVGCQAGGVGDPCVPEDEYQTEFSGYAVQEVNIESRSFQCTTRVCLVNHFQGRVTCPYGQSAPPVDAKGVYSGGQGKDPKLCRIPGTDGSDPKDVITVAVKAQLAGPPDQGGRRADDTVYCSCRCDGPDPNARYCQCPSGYECTALVKDLGSGLGSTQLAGSYCVRNGTKYTEVASGGGIKCLAGSAKGDSAYCGNDGKNP